MKYLPRIPMATIVAVALLHSAHAQLLKGLWEFDDSSNLGKATFGTDLVINGTAPAWTASQTYGSTTLSGVVTTVAGIANGFTATHGIGVNGGGSTKTNEYTFVFDVSRPNTTAWRCFWQSTLANNDDGEFFVRGGGGTVNSLGRGSSPGYTTGTLAADTWQRLVVSIDNGTHFRVYLDGALMAGGARTAQSVDNASYGLDPNQVLLFRDNTANENLPLVVGLAAIYDGALTDAQVAALGSAGTPIPLPKPALQWTGAASGLWTSTAVGGLRNWVLQSDGTTPAEYQDNSDVLFNPSSGNLTVTVDAAGVAPKSMTFNDDGVNYNLTGGTISGTGGLIKNGDGTLTLALSGTFAGATQVTEGTLRIADPLALSGSTVSGVFGSSQIIFGPIASASFGGLGGDADLLLASDETTPQPVELRIGGNGSSTTYSGEISGPGSLTKAGGGALALTLESTFSGGMRVNGGTIRAQDPAALGSGAVVHNGGQVRFSFGNGSDETVANDFTLSATGHQTFVIRGNADAAPTVPTSVTLSGKISGGAAGQIYRLLDTTTVQNHNNILKLTNAANDFQGTIEMWRGTLAFTSDGALGDADNDIIHYTENINGAIRFDAADITLGPNRTITFPRSGGVIRPFDTNGFNARIEGSIETSGTSGSAELVKKGAGTLTLAGATTFAGTVRIDAGTLALDGTALLDAVTSITTAAGSTFDVSAVEQDFFLNAGRLLRGDGVVAGALEAGGTIAPGTTGTLGTLTLTKGLSLANGTLQLEFDSRNTQSDRLVVTGGIELDPFGSLAITDLAGAEEVTLAAGTKITLIEYTGTINGLLDINGALAVADGASIVIGPNTFILDYDDTTDGVNSGKYVTLTVPGAPPSVYSTWATAHAGGQAPDEDFDKDGVPNGVEYFMGETGSTFTALPTIVTTGGVRTITWPRDPDAVASFSIQTSNTLTADAWTTITAPDPSIDTSTPNQLVFTLPVGGPALFARLVVTVTP